MPAIGAKRVGVIGAGMVGVCAASWLQRDGHSVFLIEPDEPGHGASFGNAGCFNGSSVTPIVDARCHVERSALAVRPARAVVAALELSAGARSVAGPLHPRRHARTRRRRQARALRPLVGPTLEALQPLVRDAGAEDLVHRLGHLYVYRSAASLAKDRLAWELRRENGVEIDEFDADELRQLEPALSRDYVRGMLVRENGHTSNPLGIGRASGRAFRALGRRAGAGAGARLSPRWRPARRDRDRRRRPRCRRRNRLRRGLFKTARRGARRQGAARNRARLSPDDPRSRSHAAHPDRRCRRQVRRDADGYRAALCRHGRARRSRGAARLAARPDLARAGAQDAARPRRRSHPKSGSRCGWAIGRACPTRCRCSARRARRRT